MRWLVTVGRGETGIEVSWDGELRATLVVADTARPTSREAVAELRALGLTPILLTGDRTETARAIAARHGGSLTGLAEAPAPDSETQA